MNKDQPEKGTQLNAVEIHDNILAPAEEEIQRPAASLFWSAFSAGLVIGFSFLASAFATQQVSRLAPPRGSRVGLSARVHLRQPCPQ